AESERQAQCAARRAARTFNSDLRPTALVGPIAMERPRQESLLERDQADGGLDDPRGAERVSRPSLRGARERRGGNHLSNDGCLYFVVLPRRRAVQIDVVELLRRESRCRERLLER